MGHRVSRRTAGKLILAAPVAAATAGAAAWQQPDPAPGPSLGACLAGQDPGLTPEERVRVEKAVGNLRSTLAAVRDFRVPAGTSPALGFAALKSARKT